MTADAPARSRAALTGAPRRSPAPRRSRAAFDAAAHDGRAALIPYAVAGYPDAASAESGSRSR